MPRQPRIEFPDAVYHVTARGLERRNIVASDKDRNIWVDLFDRTASRRGWRVLAWSLMDNHFHLFLRTPNADLSAGMHDLNSGYASVFNRLHERNGPLLQGRYKSILVERDFHYLDLSRYVHLNPVRAGLVDDPAGYRWSSCQGYFQPRKAHPWLAWEEVLENYGRTLPEARREYRAFLAEGIAAGSDKPLDELKGVAAYGSPDFQERIRTLVPCKEEEQFIEDGDKPKCVNIEEIEAAVRAFHLVSIKTLSHRGKNNEPRKAAVYMVRKLTSTPLRAIGERFGGIGPQAVHNIVAEMIERREADPEFSYNLDILEKRILAE